jgi:hypothetical protein
MRRIVGTAIGAAVLLAFPMAAHADAVLVEPGHNLFKLVDS